MSSLRLGILSDLHRTTRVAVHGQWHNEYDFAGHAARVQRALAWFEQEAVDALAVCGDLIHFGDDAEAMTAVLGECCAALDVAVLVVSGNHDVACGEDILAAGIARAADDRLVLGDASGVLLSGVRVAGLHVEPTTGYSRSSLRALPAIDDWDDEPVVLVSHLPILSRAAAVAARGMPSTGDLVDREQAVALLQTREAATIVAAGHMHVRDAHAEGRVLQLLQAAMIEPPFDAAVLDVRTEADGAVHVTRRALSTSDQRGTYEPTLAEPVGTWRFEGGRWEATDRTTPVGDDGATAVGSTASGR